MKKTKMIIQLVEAVCELNDDLDKTEKLHRRVLKHQERRIASLHHEARAAHDETLEIHSDFINLVDDFVLIRQQRDAALLEVDAFRNLLEKAHDTIAKLQTENDRITEELSSRRRRNR